MNKALIFGNSEKEIISAQNVLDNFESYKGAEFVDPEYQFKVVFVKDCKGHTGPYFRFYLSREDYVRLSPERKTKYDILARQRHFRDGPWHRYWEDKLEKYGKTEYYVKSSDSECYKRADFFYDKGKTCVELQHSFIADDFEERNKFYSNEGLNIIWLYDLTHMSVSENKDGFFEILENNAKGFFKISEKPENLREYPVFIQVKGGTIYLVKELLRKEIDNNLKSTIRLFKPAGVYTEDEFVNGVLNCNNNFKSNPFIALSGKTVYELWNKDYSMMLITDGTKSIEITRGKDDGMYSTLDYQNILYRFIDWYEHNKSYQERSQKQYPMSHEEANTKKWILLRPFYKKKKQ